MMVRKFLAGEVVANWDPHSHIQSSLNVQRRSASADVDDTNTEAANDDLTGLTRIVVKDLV